MGFGIFPFDLEIEPYIPTAMDDWDEAFWKATGMLVPGSTWGAANPRTVIVAPGFVGKQLVPDALYLPGHPRYEELLNAVPGQPIRIWG